MTIDAEIEKTCENCKYEFEDMEGVHCRHCIHNAEEHFEPKEENKDCSKCSRRSWYQKGYAQAIDEFAERMKQGDVIECMETWDMSYEAISRFIDGIAEQLKVGVRND